MFRAIGIPAERNLTECRTGNAGDPDLPLDCPWVVQAKVGGTPRVWTALREAKEAASPEMTPVAILRRNGSGSRPPDDVAVLPLADFFRLVAAVEAS